MAITKQRKVEILDQYAEWFKKSHVVIMVEYTNATMKEMELIRSKVRESGGEFHVLKNTLAKKAFVDAGINVPDSLFENSTAAAFAFNDIAATAKSLAEATKGLEYVKVKGGVMETNVLSVAQVKALAELPPLPVVRAQLLGVLQAPASKLVRTVAEPARQIASVLKAYADKSAPAAA